LLLETFTEDLIAAALDNNRDALVSLGYKHSDEWPDAELRDALPHFKKLIDMNGINGFNAWIIVDRAAKDIVGSIGFIGNPDTEGYVEIGFGIIPSKRRMNYCFEAGECLIDWALEQTGVSGIIAKCDTGNYASIKVLQKLGFVRVKEEGAQIVWVRGRDGV
jgi:RimJ/RimL family protein N-acetyltransferase